ncbi:MAG: hypothetical protein HYV95_12625 [Opitutae bacterium]|nr:hypothetical protein [Opitutae bacterium]
MGLAIGLGRGVMGKMKFPHGTVAAWLGMGRCALGVLLALVSVRLAAVERRLEITAPAAVAADKNAEVTISASTDAGRGEQVGFLQVDFSLDGGKTWTALCYVDNVGPRVVRQVSLKPGAAGTPIRVRARAAFRDGLAGDVDYHGAAIRWHESWNDWGESPAKHAEIAVTAR